MFLKMNTQLLLIYVQNSKGSIMKPTWAHKYTNMQEQHIYTNITENKIR